MKLNIKETFDAMFTVWLIVVAIQQMLITEYLMSGLTFFFSGLKLGYKIKELELLVIKLGFGEDTTNDIDRRSV